MGFKRITEVGIKIDKSWQYAIDLIFNNEEDVASDKFIADVYLILMSYLQFKELRVLAVMTISNEKISKSDDYNEKIILSSTNAYILRDMKFNEFADWWKKKRAYEYRYEEVKNFYGFRIVFEKNILMGFLKKNEIPIEDFHLYLIPNLPPEECVLNV